MLKIKPCLNFVVVVLAIAGLVLVIGCGNSSEKQQMTDFINDFDKTVEEYAKAEEGQKAELEAKLESYLKKWTQMKMDMAEELTPQVLDKLDADYQKLAEKFKSLSGKS